jgi:pyruvate decarboxylase
VIDVSIGYSVGAVLGAALAARELPDGGERRVILFVGEGSLQLTVQEISTIIKSGLKPILYLPRLKVDLTSDSSSIIKDIRLRSLSTEGTSTSFVESLVTCRAYNNVANWKYGKLLEVFGAENPRSFRVESKEELSKLLSDKEFSEPKDVQVLSLCYRVLM